MALNIKNREVEELLDSVVRLTGESKTEAVRRALEERRHRLSFRIADERRGTRLRRYLEDDVWPTLPASERGRRLGREEEEDLLGYGEHGV
mgnify:FL=1